MDTELLQKFPFILDRNLAKANCTGNRVCTPCDIGVLVLHSNLSNLFEDLVFELQPVQKTFRRCSVADCKTQLHVPPVFISPVISNQ